MYTPTIKCVIYLTTLMVSVPYPQACLQLDTKKQPKEVKRTPEQEAEAWSPILWSQHTFQQGHHHTRTEVQLTCCKKGVV